MILGLAVLTAAMAAPAEQEARAWALLEIGEAAQVVEETAAWLRDDPGDLGSHRLYVRALSEWRDDAAVMAEYRAWHSEDRDDPLRRVALAAALAVQPPGPWCNEAARLLEGAALRTLPALRVWEDVAVACDGDVAAALPEAVEGDAEALSARVRVGHKLTRGERATVAEAWRQQPWRLVDAVSLWDGRGNKGLRREAVAVAEAQVNADELAVLVPVREVLRRADRPEARALATESLRQLHPEAVAAEQRRKARGLVRFLEPVSGEHVYAVLTRARAEAEPPGQAVFDGEMARRAALDGEFHRALAGRRGAFDADPTPAHVLGWGDAAARWGDAEDVASATEALDALDDDARAGERAVRVRGQLLLAAGHVDPAVLVLREAYLLDGSAESAAWLGIASAAAGHDQEALAMAAEGLATLSGDPDLADRAHAAADEVWSRCGRWDPGGVDGYLAAVAAARAPERPDWQRHPVVGTRLVDVSWIDGTGITHDTLPQSEVLVLELWASWCAPCIEAMPHLAELQALYGDAGVEVLGLSVDSQAKLAARAVGKHRWSTPWGWAGPGLLPQLEISGIPATLLIDREGTIRGLITGWRGPGDDRVDRAVATLVAP